MIKQLCILTKSYKNGGYCVAGIDMETSRWMRLVSNDSGNDEIPYEFMDKWQNRIEVLDIVEVEIIKTIPKNCQKENCLINLEKPLKKIKSITFEEILNFKGYDKRRNIFGNRGKAITPSDAELLSYSLILIPVTNLQFSLIQNKDNYKWICKDLTFTYNDSVYTLPITDPEFKKEEYHNKQFSRASIVVSIPSEPYNEWHNKFVAKIFLI